MSRRVVADLVGGPSCVEKCVMTDGLAPKRQRFGNHDDQVYMDDSDNVLNCKLDVNSIHCQHDRGASQVVCHAGT